MQNFNFIPNLKTRRGSQIVEASMVLPLTILILAALISVMMTFYVDLLEQIKENEVQRDALYTSSEVTRLRLKDRLKQAGREEDMM